MRHLTIAVVAALLGTGCIVTDDDDFGGTLDLTWSFVRTLDNGSTVTYGCSQAGIDNVVLSFGTFDTVLPCGAGRGVVRNLPPGTHTVLVTGRRGTASLYDAPATVTILDRQVTAATLPLLGIPDELDIFVSFRTTSGTSGWAACLPAGVSSISYSLVDWAGTVVAEGLVPCVDPAGVSFAGANAIDRDNYVVRFLGFPAGSSVEEFDSATTAISPQCDGQAFDHYGPSVGPTAVDVFLYDIVGTTRC